MVVKDISKKPRPIKTGECKQCDSRTKKEVNQGDCSRTASNQCGSKKTINTDCPIKQRNCSRRFPLLASRQAKLLDELFKASSISREQCDRLAPASNSPEVVRQLRNKLGLAIPCEMHARTLPSGERIRFGMYSLSPADRVRLTQLGWERRA